MPIRQRVSCEEVRNALTGPVTSITTPFCRDGSIDLAGLRNIIDFDINAGSKTVILTYGDSLYSVLTDQEVGEVTKVVVEHTAGRAMVVAADRQWWIGKTVEFAKYCNDIGADVLMVLPPNWANSCTAETFAEHYAAVAKCIPVMIVTNLFAECQAVGLKALKLLKESVNGIVAVKDDIYGEFGRKMQLLVHDQWAVICGGWEWSHLNMLPYGCDGWFSTFLTFKPSVAHAYRKAIQLNDLAKARDSIAKYEMPYFEYIRQLKGGFDAGIHGTLELFGICGRWRRKPYYSLNDKEMEKLADFFKSRALL